MKINAANPPGVYWLAAKIDTKKIGKVTPIAVAAIIFAVRITTI